MPLSSQLRPAAHPVYLEWRAFYQSVQVCCVCVCDACLYLNVYLCLGVCLSVFMLQYNGLLYHYKCYYILALPL